MKAECQTPKILQSENRMFPDLIVANVYYHPSKRKNYPKSRAGSELSQRPEPQAQRQRAESDSQRADPQDPVNILTH